MDLYSKLLTLAAVFTIFSTESVVNAQVSIPRAPRIKAPSIPIPKCGGTLNLEIPTVKIPTVNIPKIDKKYLRSIDPRARIWGPRPLTLQEMLPELLEEFGPCANYGLTDNYVCIYDTADYYAEWGAGLCERVDKTYGRFAMNMGLRECELVEPLPIIFFTNYEDYYNYARIHFEGYSSLRNKPVGFYSNSDNRMVVFDYTQSDRYNCEDPYAEHSLSEVTEEILTRSGGARALKTIIHEATHQVSFNRGLFKRNNRNPGWAVEGLAMLFETPVGAIEEGGWMVRDEFAFNSVRALEFLVYFGGGIDGAEYLYDLVGSDKVPLNDPRSYCASWALFTYLYRNHPQRLSAYLNHIASSNRQGYKVGDRLNEFEYYFTKDWNCLFQEIYAFVNETFKDPTAFGWGMTPVQVRSMQEELKEKEKKDDGDLPPGEDQDLSGESDSVESNDCKLDDITK